MNCQLEQIVTIVAAFVSKTHGAAPGAVKAETRLFQEGFVDSFSLMELTVAIEEGLGVQLPDGTLIPEDFESPRAVFERLQQI